MRKTGPSDSPSTSIKGDLTHGSIPGHLLRLSVPMVWGIMAIISFQLVDMFYVSRLGSDHLAALSFTFPVNMTVFSLIMGLSIATSSVISRLIGEGDKETARRVITHGLIIALLTGCIIAAIGLAVMEPLFQALGADPSHMNMIIAYMTIWFPASIFLAIPMVANSAIRAGGDTVVPALIMTLVAIINIVLDPFLIFGWWIFPRLELQGAAISTLVANLCAAGVAIYVLARPKDMLLKTGLMLDKLGNSAKRLALIAIPAGLTSTIQPVSNGVLIALLSQTGTEAVAAYGIVSRVEAFAFIIIMALATGMGPMIGQNWGASRFDRVNQTLRTAISFAVLWSLTVAALLAVLAKPIAQIFTDDPEIIEIARFYFVLVPITYALGNLVHGWSSAFNAMGRPERSFIMNVTKMFVLLLPLAWIGEMYYGYAGIFYAIALTNVIAGLSFHLWNHRTCRQEEEKRRDDQAPA